MDVYHIIRDDLKQTISCTKNHNSFISKYHKKQQQTNTLKQYQGYIYISLPFLQLSITSASRVLYAYLRRDVTS